MPKSKPKVIVLAGYGLNCEDETKFAFDLAGAQAEIVHINDLISGTKKLSAYQILAVPGGFAYGDDTGSGKAYANRINNHLRAAVDKFVAADKLVIGLCNGFQVLTNLGLLPGALTFNDSATYIDRWVDLKVVGRSPWLEGIDKLSVPIAHGEGKYFADKKLLAQLEKSGTIAAKYFKGQMCAYQNLPANPNGSLQDIAAVTAYNGRVIGLMPHPERGMFFTQLPNWPLLKEQILRSGVSASRLPKNADGLKIFQNGVRYFK